MLMQIFPLNKHVIGLVKSEKSIWIATSQSKNNFNIEKLALKSLSEHFDFLISV